MPRRRPHTDDTNWRLRDNVTWFTEQAKGARELLGDVRRAPREMLRDLRDDAPPADGGIAAGDEALAPIEGVGFDLWVEASAQIIDGGVPASGREALAESLGVPAGSWPAAQAAWARRAAADPRLAARQSSHLEHRLRALRAERA